MTSSGARGARGARSMLSVALLLGASACASLPGAGPTPAEQVRARLLRIEDTRADEPAFLDSLLDGPEVWGRADAALTVGRIGARRHLSALHRIALAPDTLAAANALFALGLLKDSTGVPPAAGRLGSGGGVSVEAAWLLGEVGARDSIVAALGRQGLPSDTRGALLLAATRVRPFPAAAVLPHVESADSAVAWRAAYALARGRGTAGLRDLLSHARSPWAAVREQVARAASRGLAGDSLATAARVALRPLLTDTSAHVRINAVRSFGSYGAVAREEVLAALRDRDAGVRLTAAQSLDAVLDSSVATWSTAFAVDSTLVMQQTIAASAARHGVWLVEAQKWRTNPEWQRRAAYADLGARRPASQVIPEYDAAVTDLEGRVRAAAIASLAGFRDTVSVRAAVRARLQSALQDADVGVRTTALTALARGATVNDLAAALASYELARGDGDNDARLAFWTLADTVLRRTTSLPDSIERRVAALARPAEPLERNAAARLTRFAAWRDSTSRSRAVSWYESRAREAAGAPPVLHIETTRGTMELELFVNDAPLTVFNIVSLARRGYFDGQQWHRVVPNFVVQGGDPRGNGNGGPGYAIRDELNRRRYERGVLGMALSGPNTGGSQFFITHSPQPHLDGGYTVFGRLLRGAEVLDAIVQGDRIVRITVR